LPDGELSPTDAALVQAHLAACDACRCEADAFLGLGEVLRAEAAPETDLPTGAEAVAWILDREQSERGGVTGASRVSRGARWAMGITLAALAVAALLLTRPATRPSWSVARLAGAPTVGAARLRDTGRLGVGQWLETDGASKARLEVADIGQVEIEPNTRVQLRETRASEHRLALARGAMSAHILAPPRLFLVETPSAVAVDLGCSYTLEVDDVGRSLLRVTLGWVAFVWHGRELIVPAGAACATRPPTGPGTPYFEDAPAALRSALARFDFEEGGRGALDVVLAQARRRDALTLWHLLPRVADVDRRPLYDRLVTLVAPPQGVTRDGVLRLEPGMLALWKTEIERVWWE
jgi:Putative zinc-finger/FecR protein